METIKNYLETMFAQIPQTPETLKIKEDLLSNMEEKYHELKNEGKSENEAIGIVISEFGNIDELMNEFGISNNSTSQTQQKNHPIITLETALTYLDEKNKFGRLIAIGVALILIGVNLLICLSTFAETGILGSLSEDTASMFGVIALICFIVPAVALFIYSGTSLEKYNYLENPFQMDPYVKEQLKTKFEDFLPTFNRAIIIGVSLCILSVIPVIAGSLIEDNRISNASFIPIIKNSSSFGVILLLIIVTVAVYIFIIYGNMKEGYNRLLELEEYSPEHKNSKSSKIIGAVASVVWPLTVCVFFYLGFFKQRWDISWVVFPITGILFGAFSTICNTLSRENRIK
ncbi:permease prefix domain 1-containing protein [Anaerosacchariphilus polymeriproducens]|uniref:Uncharacterized protein n=1 Tax=Anaerosacchariphilus polymeriproducens TaxID=1812858 RepID=A0A371AWG4_9FIRM|nr:permease prefix domain 1-containing protein [Anaerosacchariphilus polymeriproducens]RDU23903.1 hypothetical protein DWV06_06290 [Anaerosacchariphilus polymeriproducens]